MERQEVSEGSGGGAGCPAGDLQIMGTGQEAPAPSNESGVAAPTGDNKAERLRQQRNDASRRWKERNRARVLERDRNFKREMRANGGREKERQMQAEWRDKNRDHLRSEYAKYRAANREKRIAQQKASNERTKDQRRLKRLEKYKANREKILEYNRKWMASNPEKMKAKHIAYLPKAYENRKRRRAANPIERIKDACRTRVGFILKKAGIEKFNHTFELVGCTPNFLKSFLEAQFLPGMSWDNYGEWEIDHITPLASFNLVDRCQRLAAFNYSNCKPLWRPDNRSKSDSLPGPHQPLLV